MIKKIRIIMVVLLIMVASMAVFKETQAKGDVRPPIPKSVNIGGYQYEVQMYKNLEYNGKEMQGLCWYAEQVIELEDSLSYEKKVLVLLHEILHGMAYEYSLNLDKLNDQEYYADTQSQYTLQILRTNPELLKCIEAIEIKAVQ